MSNEIIPDNSKYCYKTPVKVTRHTEKDIWFEKRYVTVRQTEYTSRIIDDHCITEEKCIKAERVGYCPRFSAIIISMIFIGIIAVIIFYNLTNPQVEAPIVYKENVKILYADETLNAVIESGELTDGRVFPNSSKEKISDEQLEQLEQKYDEEIYAMLLRLAINEVYASHGFSFSDSNWKQFYMNTEWYHVCEGEEIDYSCFNEIEIYNVEKLVKREKRLKDLGGEL